VSWRGTDVSEGDLLAFVDGALDPSRAAEVAAHLAAEPETAAKVEEWRRQNQSLRALYRHVEEEDVPHRLRAVLRPAPARSRRWPLAAAAVFLLLLGAAAGWHGRARWGSDSDAAIALGTEAAAAHAVFAREVVHPVEVRAGERSHLQAWLSKRLSRPLRIPDLERLGMTFVGGRLLPGAQGVAAQLMYEDETGRRVTLYVVPSQDETETAFRYERSTGLEVVVWSDEGLDCALVGDFPRERLRELGEEAYRQLA
jgi:anti-sigma factor RsiW